MTTRTATRSAGERIGDEGGRDPAPHLRDAEEDADQIVARRLAAGAAHQINNVLTIVSGHASVLLEILEDGDAARPGLEAILDASVSGAALASQLLSYAWERASPSESVEAVPLLAEATARLREVVGPRLEVIQSATGSATAVRVTPQPLYQGLEFVGHYARALLGESGGRVTVGVGDDVDGSWTLRVRIGSPSPSGGPGLLEPYAHGSGVGKPDGLWLPAAAGAVRQAGGTLSAAVSDDAVELRVQLRLDG
ncbi:MAG: hypothetical protein HKN73_09535 [Gemmatimonadetes bacterium]|nr:hypothetical protein [Gemmatimonadota bacterium]